MALHHRLFHVLFFTLIWCGFSNNFALLNILLGALLSWACVCIVMPKNILHSRRIHLGYLLVLVAFTVYQLVRSSLIVAWDIITPQHLNQPNIISLNLASNNKLTWTIVGNLVSLTPGTLCIDISEHGEMLVHDMFSQHAEQTKAFIQNKLEPLVIKAFGE